MATSAQLNHATGFLDLDRNLDLPSLGPVGHTHEGQSMIDRLKRLKWEWIVVLLAVAYPLLIVPEQLLAQWTGISIGMQLTYIFIYAILALGLNVVVGYTGLLHLGIAAFFGIGTYITGILTVPAYPFQIGFTAALVLSTVARASAGIVLGMPTLPCGATIWRS